MPYVAGRRRCTLSGSVGISFDPLDTDTTIIPSCRAVSNAMKGGRLAHLALQNEERGYTAEDLQHDVCDLRQPGDSLSDMVGA